MAKFKLFHNNPNFETLQQYAVGYKIRLDSSFSLEDFFEYNKDIIFNQLSHNQLLELSKSKMKNVKDLSSDDIDKNIILPCPCYLFIDDKYITNSLVTKNTNFQIQETDFIAFADEQIRKITSEMKYFSAKEGFEKLDIQKTKPGCRVIGWFKSLYYSGKKSVGEMNNIYNSSSNFIDITPFITQMNINVSQQGGSFSLTLPHIPVYTSNLSDDNVIAFHQSINSDNFVSKEQMMNFFIANKKEVTVKSSFSSLDYFEWLIQHNDLLFISFDDIDDLTDDNLCGKNFDMIALVDNVSVNKNAQSASISVSVSGRDLMKLITDDASIFFPAGVAASDGRIFDNTETTIKGGDIESVMRYKGVENQDGSPRQLTHMLDVFATEPNDFSIDFVIKTVISHLANIQITPDDLFVCWGDKRTKFSDLKSKSNEKN